MQGKAPLAIRSFKIAGVEYPITWTTETNWTIRVSVMTPGQNVTLMVSGYDANGIQVGAQQQVTVNYSGTQIPGSQPVINEWMVQNNGGSVVVDPADGNFQAWIEIYNPSTTALGLDNYTLELKHSSTTADFTIPGGTKIGPGGFLLIWADTMTDQNGQNGPDGALHANFKLRDNDTLKFFDNSGTQLGGDE